MRLGVLGTILLVVAVIVCAQLYLNSESFNLRCIISDVDGNRYCVRDRSQLSLAADMLARTTEKMKRLTAYCGEKYPEKANVRRLVEGFNPQKISETLPTSEHTAYSENKGEKIAFCLDKKKHTPLDEHGISRESKMIDPNTLMFVAIHEMAHVATESIGHGDEFWENFKFLLEVAAEVGVYSPEDYKKRPQEYCGMRITDNPYYDM